MEIKKFGNFRPTGKQKKKHQIILTHTSRNLNDYLECLSNRFNGNYDKIPNYIIARNGEVYQLLGNTEHTNYFNIDNINRNSIIVSLENLGWLQKEPLKDYYVNWIGDIYKGKTYDKKWRDYYFWHPYTKEQMDSTVELCKKLFKDMSIKSQTIGHNTKINGSNKFEGVITKSNFHANYTDVSPAFNFEEFLKKIENE
jgi:N-acetyl-anhydromuramyl-L-alanine amidase AmpD